MGPFAFSPPSYSFPAPIIYSGQSANRIMQILPWFNSDRQGRIKEEACRGGGWNMLQSHGVDLTFSALREASPSSHHWPQVRLDWNSLRGREGTGLLGLGLLKNMIVFGYHSPGGYIYIRAALGISISTSSPGPFWHPHGQSSLGDVHCSSLGCRTPWKLVHQRLLHWQHPFPLLVAAIQNWFLVHGHSCY